MYTKVTVPDTTVYMIVPSHFFIFYHIYRMVYPECILSYSHICFNIFSKSVEELKKF